MYPRESDPKTPSVVLVAANVTYNVNIFRIFQFSKEYIRVCDEVFTQIIDYFGKLIMLLLFALNLNYSINIENPRIE